MKTDKEFLQEARDFQRATVKAVSTLIRGTPDLLKMLDLRGADFRGADLRDVDFSAAILTGSIFHNADLENAQFQGADLSGSEFDDETDELASVKALSATLIRNVADRDKEIAALSKNDAVLKDSIARINSLHEIIEARDKEIAELRAEISTTLIIKGAEKIKAHEQTADELAEANREIQRLTLVVAELSHRDRIQGDTIRRLEISFAKANREIAELKETASGRRDPELGKLADQVERLGREVADREQTIRRLIEARDKTEEALESKDALIAKRGELIAELRDAQNRPGIVAAPGSILIKLERGVDPANKTAHVTGRIYDADGDHYSPGFGVKAVVVGRSSSDVLREMSENWSRAGFME